MTYTFSDLYELMPKLDCSSCGNPSCRTMARKIAVGEKNVEQCVNLDERRKNKIRKILEEGIRISAKAEVVSTEAGITYIHPCVSEAGKVAAESRLKSLENLQYGFFDPYMMCSVLQMIDFPYKCSPKLGIAKMEIGDKTVIVYSSGRINVRRAESREDALATIKLVSRIMWGAIICSCCGNVGIDCASGGCDDCIDVVCPVLAGGPPGSDVRKVEESSGSSSFIRVDELETGKIFMEGFSHLQRAYDRIMKFFDLLIHGKKMDAGIEKELKNANRLAIDFILKTERVQDASLGLLLAGISMDLRRIWEGLASVLVVDERIRESLTEARWIVKNGFEAFKHTDLSKGSEVITKYKEFRKQTFSQFMKEKDEEIKKSLVGIEKAATNGFYIARLLPKPLPG